MDNYAGDGKTIPFTAGAAYSSGAKILLGTDLPGVVKADVANGDQGQALLTGRVRLSVKGHNGTADAAIDAGAKVYWDGSAAFLNSDSGDTLFGRVLSAVPSGQTVEREVLIGRG